MKNLKKAELIVIALTLLCLVFTAGYFTGRGSTVQVISFDRLTQQTAPSPSPYNAAATSAEASSDVIAGSPASSPDITPTGQAEQPSVSKININTASPEALDALPGIGPVLAQSIRAYREKIGGFKSIEQIMDVDGIGEKKFAAMKDMITVG